MSQPNSFTPSGSFFPHRPVHAVLHDRDGVLLAYGIGNHEGAFSPRLVDGTVDQYILAYPNRIDGRHYDCSYGPGTHYDANADRSLCKEFPAAIHFGKTRVRATCWNARDPFGRAMKISDSIRILTSGS